MKKSVINLTQSGNRAGNRARAAVKIYPIEWTR